MSEVDTYKIFRELEARRKRANPYKFYDKDELIDEILKNEDEIERLNNDYLEMKDNFRVANDEIERLNKQYELMEEALEDKAEEIERLNNIIKEVREYIEEQD